MSDSISAEQLRLFVERIERLEEEKKGIGDDIKDTYSEAKGTGFDVKTMRTLANLSPASEPASGVVEALENALCAPNWSQSLAHVHSALAALASKGESAAIEATGEL